MEIVFLGSYFSSYLRKSPQFKKIKQENFFEKFRFLKKGFSGENSLQNSENRTFSKKQKTVR